MSPIESKLHPFKRRIRVVRAWRFAAIGGAVGAFASTLGAIADWAGWLLLDIEWLAAPVAAGFVLGFLIGAFLRTPAKAIAESIDRRARLKDRLRTAISEPDGVFADLQTADAQSHLDGLRPAVVYPVRFTKWHAALASLSILAASIFMLGNSFVFASSERRADAKELEKAAIAVERIARPVAETKFKEDSDEIQKLAEKMRRMAREMKKGKLDKQEALQKANDLDKQARELTQRKFEETERELSNLKERIADTARSQMLEAGLQPDAIKGFDPVQAAAGQSLQSLDRELKMLQLRIQELSRRLNQTSGMSQEQIAQLKKELEQAKEDQAKIELTKKAREFLERLANHPAFKELMEMAAKLERAVKDGKQLKQSLTPEEIKAMMDRLEGMADQYKTDEDIRRLIEQMMAALQKGGGA